MGGTYDSAASDAAAPKTAGPQRPRPQRPSPQPTSPQPASFRAPAPAASKRAPAARPGAAQAPARARPIGAAPDAEPPRPQRRIQDQMDRIRARKQAQETAAQEKAAQEKATRDKTEQKRAARDKTEQKRAAQARPTAPPAEPAPKAPPRPPRLSEADEAELARTAAAMNRTRDITDFEPIARGALEAEPQKALQELHRLGEQLSDRRVRDQLERMIDGALRPKAGARPAAPTPPAGAPPRTLTVAPDAQPTLTSATGDEEDAATQPSSQSDWLDETIGESAAWALDKAAGVGRALGLDHAADNLEHFLEGSGQDRTLSREEARTRAPVIEGEKMNQKRFEEFFTINRTSDPNSPNYNPQFEYRAHLLTMRDGDVVRLPDAAKPDGVPTDYWDSATDRLDSLMRGDVDEALATGRSNVKSSAPHGFTATRKGDTITLHGEVVHDWSDDYDFHEGSDGWIGEPARDHGGAAEFRTVAEWRQALTATFKIVDGELVPQDFVWRDLD